MNTGELTLEVYAGTTVLQDYGNFYFDGPGGPGEKVLVRTDVENIFHNAQKIIDLLDGHDEEGLIKFLKSLPKEK